MSGISDLPNQQIGVIMDKTNFYAEQGGQEYDTGRIVIDGVAELEVENVQVYAGYVLHTGYMKYGTFAVGDTVISEFDEARRNPIRNNHSGTHVLNYALRKVLGNGIDQRGSLVAPEKLRFDFSHKAQINDKELESIEKESTTYIRQNSGVYTRDVPLSIAREIAGVRAVFGETYPDPVRVVSIGVDLETILENPTDSQWADLSIEFCGGTHVNKTGDIKDLIVIEESGIAKGIRRIIAVTGEDAAKVQRLANDFNTLLTELETMPFSPKKERAIVDAKKDLDGMDISALRKSEFRKRLEKLSKEVLENQKAAQKAESKKALDAVTSYFKEHAKESVAVLRLPISGNSKIVPEVIKHVQSKMKDKSVLVIASDNVSTGKEGRVTHGCYVSPVSCCFPHPDLPLEETNQKQSATKAGLQSSEWAASVSGVVGGKAGGKQPTAVGNGTETGRVDEALEVATAYLKKFSV